MPRIVIYVDGASSNNQDAGSRVGGWAYVMMLEDDQGQPDPRPEAYREAAGRVAGATNNQMELEAVRQALLAVKQRDIPVTIRSDSTYVIGMLSKGWKAKENQALIADLRELLARFRIRFEKVKGHAGNTYNERADQLAVAQTRLPDGG